MTKKKEIEKMFPLMRGNSRGCLFNKPLSRICNSLRSYNFDLSLKGRGDRPAFTLAEVLITLGIIGIVAAMTIPTLVANYQEKSWNTSAQVFERKLTEALRVMNTQQTLAGHTTTQSFVDELAKHFKIVKTCDSNNLKNCVEENITWNIIDISNGGSESESLNLASLKTAADLGKSDWGTETIGVQFANGTTAVMAYDPECRQDPYSNQVTGMSCISMIYDTSGGKSPNATSKDVRGFNNKVSNTAFKLNGKIFGQPFMPEPHVWNECNSGVSTNPSDLKIMSDYNIQYCLMPDCNSAGCYSNDKDYWAGAVKVCGGPDKLPAESDLYDIANYLYNTDVLSINGLVSIDIEKAHSLGFTQTSDLGLWAGDYEGGPDNQYVPNLLISPLNLRVVFSRGEKFMGICVND